MLTGQLHNRASVLGFGAAQVAFGILLALLDIIDFVFDSPRCAVHYTVTASGIWSGGFFILIGVCGIVAGRRIPPEDGPRSRRSYLISSLVLSLLGLVLAILMTAVSVPYSTIPARCFFESSIGPAVPTAHAVIFVVMLVVHCGQIVATSVNIHKIPPPEGGSTVYSMTNVPDQQGMATAVATHPSVAADAIHPSVIAIPENLMPSYFISQQRRAVQQSHIQQAVETHPKY